ncbi:CaiB/BaiF CoA transferase family protein [Porphyrobacter sp. AAP60]|uniref:CaiB/BaiF CoA transferase family protein n=1 Tax=Porphyrobacter sp. AAP60 TaxID=1523423 RepID=UPI0006B9A958|nr:CaiB/BaiF CoA-transferase family protein [Porphyrobacter sp. AAP60]KPF62228.1 carnitine dehydratase [Porphyrobacter sp. AAP60]
MTGPLAGIRIIEIAGIGPGPFCGMMLADHGAEVIRIDRPGGQALVGDPAKDLLNRSRLSVNIDLKKPEGIAAVRRLVASADGLIEGFRPGVMERLGLGPDVLLADNPKLVYGRMTGWGQDGPYAQAAGHDLNYIALSGVLDACGRAGDKPTPPMNLLGDFGGGGMMLAFGMVAALLSARTTGAGQVVDCAMTDGSAVLATMIWSLRASGRWNDARGTNFLDTGAHFYDCYETADGKFISIAPVEPQFYADLIARLGLAEDSDFHVQNDPRRWPALKGKLEALFRTRTHDEWCALLEHTDACFAPVLSMAEAPSHPHNQARGTFIEVDGITQPAPAPRYSGTPTAPPVPLSQDAARLQSIWENIGYTDADLETLQADGVIA